MNGHTKPTHYVKPRIANFFVLGYNDYTLTLPFSSSYDDWPEMDQKNYEAGRLYAADGKVIPASVTAKTKLTFTPAVDPAELGI